MAVCLVHPLLWWGLRERWFLSNLPGWRKCGILKWKREIFLWRWQFALPGVKGCCSVLSKSSWFPSVREYEGYSCLFSPSFLLEDPLSSLFFPCFLYIPSSLYFIYYYYIYYYLFIHFPLNSYTHRFPVSPSRWASSSLTEVNSMFTSLHTARTGSAVKTGQQKIGKWSKNVKSRLLAVSWKPLWLWALPPCPYLHWS